MSSLRQKQLDFIQNRKSFLKAFHFEKKKIQKKANAKPSDWWLVRPELRLNIKIVTS